jgi:hypothetical protein
VSNEPIRTRSGIPIHVDDAEEDVVLDVGGRPVRLDPEAACQLSARLATRAMRVEARSPSVRPSAEVQLQQECADSMTPGPLVAGMFSEGYDESRELLAEGSS